MTKKTVSLDDFDVGTRSNEGVEIELMHPTTGDGLGMYITIVGRYSETYQAHIKKTANDQINKARKAGRNKAVEVDQIQLAQDRGTDLLVACTTGWRTDEGKTMPFHGKHNEYSADAVRELYTSKSLPWVRTQIDLAIADDTNFLKP
jgi:hypothetical protein